MEFTVCDGEISRRLADSNEWISVQVHTEETFSAREYF